MPCPWHVRGRHTRLRPVAPSRGHGRPCHLASPHAIPHAIPHAVTPCTSRATTATLVMAWCCTPGYNSNPLWWLQQQPPVVATTATYLLVHAECPASRMQGSGRTQQGTPAGGPAAPFLGLQGVDLHAVHPGRHLRGRGRGTRATGTQWGPLRPPQRTQQPLSNTNRGALAAIFPLPCGHASVTPCPSCPKSLLEYLVTQPWLLLLHSHFEVAQRGHLPPHKGGTLRSQLGPRRSPPLHSPALPCTPLPSPALPCPGVLRCASCGWGQGTEGALRGH